jgi:hypothetical protein
LYIYYELDRERVRSMGRMKEGNEYFKKSWEDGGEM